MNQTEDMKNKLEAAEELIRKIKGMTNEEFSLFISLAEKEFCLPGR